MISYEFVNEITNVLLMKLQTFLDYPQALLRTATMII